MVYKNKHSNTKIVLVEYFNNYHTKEGIVFNRSQIEQNKNNWEQTN